MEKFKSKSAWQARANELSAAGVPSTEIKKKIGIYKEGGKEWTVHKAGDGITFVDQVGRRARGNRRNNAVKEQNRILLETLQIGGMSKSEAQAIFEKERDGYKRIEEQAKKLNETHGKGAFNAGHETAALEGGGNFGRNARLEIGKSRTRADGTKMRGNQSRGRLDETPDHVKPVMGIPRSGRGGQDTALYNLLEKDHPGIMDLGLTPYDRQEIKRNPNNANAIVTRRQEMIDSQQRRKGPRIDFSKGTASYVPDPSDWIDKMTQPQTIDTDPLGGMGLPMRGV